jgi:hypothetical protein
LAEIAGKRVTLSYVPATSADEAVIESYIPTGSSITISSLPTSLPAYLINMEPQLMIDEQVVATGSSIGLGNGETLTMTFTDANQYADTITKNLTAGEYYGIGIDAGGISAQTVSNLQTQLSNIQSRLQAQDFTGMTKDDVLGSLLYTTAISYYAEYDMMDRLQAKQMGILIARVPSDAIFSVTMNVSYMFGVATNISIAGLKMDVQRNLELTEATEGNNKSILQYMLTSGMNSSALENSVPERIFSTPTNPVQGISAVKALQIANDQGIPIFTINQNNIGTALLQLPSDVIEDIQNAVNAGKVVTVSQTQITYNGWTGVGYIIIDPTTGAGAYMISGGLSGGELFWMSIVWGVLFFLTFMASLVLPVVGGVIVAVLSGALGTALSMMIKQSYGDKSHINLPQVLVMLTNIMAQTILSYGLIEGFAAAVSVLAVPMVVAAIGAVLIIAVMLLLDYLIYMHAFNLIEIKKILRRNEVLNV